MFEALEGTSNRPNTSVRIVAVFAKTPALLTVRWWRALLDSTEIRKRKPRWKGHDRGEPAAY